MKRITKAAIPQKVDVSKSTHAAVDAFKVDFVLSQNLKNSLGVDHCPRTRTAAEIAQCFDSIAQLHQEVMIAGAVDCKCRLLYWHIVAVGASDRMTVRIGDAFFGAIQTHASGIFLIHNHPSGSLNASKEDFIFTSDMAEAGLIFGYPLLDHIIVSSKGYRSLMTAPMLKSSNSIPVTVGTVHEVAEESTIKISWKCPACKRTNARQGGSSIQIHTSDLCIPARCERCRRFTWLTARA